MFSFSLSEFPLLLPLISPAGRFHSHFHGYTCHLSFTISIFYYISFITLFVTPHYCVTGFYFQLPHYAFIQSLLFNIHHFHLLFTLIITLSIIWFSWLCLLHYVAAITPLAISSILVAWRLFVCIRHCLLRYLPSILAFFTLCLLFIVIDAIYFHAHLHLPFLSLHYFHGRLLMPQYLRYV